MTGRALVAVQFVLIAVLAAVGAPAFLRGAAPWGAWALALAAAGLAAWAVSANRPGNFNIRPEPRAGGRLVVHGPYRRVRHPMYSSLLLFAAAAAWAAGGWVGWGAAAALAAVLRAKSGIEERGLLAVHPEYAAYRERTGRFLPRLG